MGFADRYFYPGAKTLTRETVKLYGKAVIGASGAITSQVCDGFSLTLTDSEAGRYTVSLEDTYSDLLGCGVTVQEADDAAVTATEGLIAFVRNVDVADATTPQFYVQFVGTDGNASDADVGSGHTIFLEITLLRAPRPS